MLELWSFFPFNSPLSIYDNRLIGIIRMKSVLIFIDGNPMVMAPLTLAAATFMATLANTLLRHMKFPTKAILYLTMLALTDVWLQSLSSSKNVTLPFRLSGNPSLLSLAM